MNSPVAGSSRSEPSVVSRRVSDSSRSVPLTDGDLGVPDDLQLGVGERPLLHDLGGAQLVAAVDQRDLGAEAGQEGGLLDRGVATTDDGDVLVAEEEPVTRGAPRDAAAGELLLVGQAELAVAGAGRQDHGARGVGVGGRADRLDVTGEVDRDHVVGDQLGAEALGLGTHLVHQRGPHDAVTEAGEVLHLGGVHQGAAGGHRALEDEGLQGGTGGVHRGGVAGGPGADDDDVADLVVQRGLRHGLLLSAGRRFGRATGKAPRPLARTDRRRA